MSIVPVAKLWSPQMPSAPAGEDPTLPPLLDELAREEPSAPSIAAVTALVPQMSATTLLTLLRLPPKEWTMASAWLRAWDRVRETTRYTWGSTTDQRQQKSEEMSARIRNELTPLWTAVVARVLELHTADRARATPLLMALYHSPLIGLNTTVELRATGETIQVLKPQDEWPELSAAQYAILQRVDGHVSAIAASITAAPRPWTAEVEASLIDLLASHPVFGEHLIKRLVPLSPRLMRWLAQEQEGIDLRQVVVALPPELLRESPGAQEPPPLSDENSLPWGKATDEQLLRRKQEGQAWAPHVRHLVARVVAPTQDYDRRHLFPRPEPLPPKFHNLDTDTDTPAVWASDPDYAPGGIVRPPEDLEALLEAICAPGPDGRPPKIAEEMEPLLCKLVRQWLAADPTHGSFRYQDALMRWLAPWRASMGPRGQLQPAPAFASIELEAKAAKKLAERTPGAPTPPSLAERVGETAETQTALLTAFEPWLVHTDPALRQVAVEVVLGAAHLSKDLPVRYTWSVLLNHPQMPDPWRLALWQMVSRDGWIRGHTLLKSLTRPLPDHALVAWGQSVSDRLLEIQRMNDQRPGHRAHQEALVLLTEPNLPVERLRQILEIESWTFPEARRAISRNPVATADATCRAVLRRMRDPVVLAHLLPAIPPGEEGHQVVERLVKIGATGVDAMEEVERLHPGILARHATREALRPLLVSTVPAHRLFAVKIVGQAGQQTEALPLGSKRSRSTRSSR